HVVEVAEPAAVLLGGLPGVVYPGMLVREVRPFRCRRQGEVGNVVAALTSRHSHQAADAGVGRNEDHEALALEERQGLVPAVRLAQVIAEGPVLLGRRSVTQPVHQHLLHQYGLNKLLQRTLGAYCRSASPQRWSWSQRRRSLRSRVRSVWPNLSAISASL